MRRNSIPGVGRVEKYLGLRPGAFDHIPHYAQDSALDAIGAVMRLERRRIFREGLYYIVLCDLCRSSEVAAKLGVEQNKSRIEGFILTCIEALGSFEPRNYFLPVREIGDAFLILFSSFQDVLEWWDQMNVLLAMRSTMWEPSIAKAQRRLFRLQAKTVVHLGEVAYSAEKVPVAQAVNEVFKIEKKFGAQELGATEPVCLTTASILREKHIRPKAIGEVIMPGGILPTRLFRLRKYSDK